MFPKKQDPQSRQSPTKSPVSKKQQDDNQFIGHYQEAPAFMKDNQHITHGYRIGFNTPRKILKSLFMTHNETVNIWTHFFPAVFIIGIIFYLLLYFKSHELILEFESGKNKLYESISSYSQALNDYALVIKMKKMTVDDFEEIEKNLLTSYTEFLDGTQIWRKNALKAVSDFGESLKYEALDQMHEIENLKMQFENEFVPYVMNQIMETIDPEKLMQINQKLQSIKTELDSDNFKYLELLYKKTGTDQSISRWPIFIFLFSALFSLLGSALFHLFYPMSGKAYQAFIRLDYAGINILITGTSFPVLYYGMYCTPDLAAYYLIFIVTIGLSLFVATLFEFLHRPQNFVLKSCAYGGFGASIMIPIGHAIINEIFYNNHGDNFSIITSVDEYAACGVCYLIGLVIFTTRCPERRKPGQYNICGHSHQIWHCMVVLGVVFTYLGALQNLQMRRNSTCPAQTCPSMLF